MALAVGIAVLVMQFIKPTIVKQHSMEPNFHTDDYLFVSRQSYKLFGNEPTLGDVIVFRSHMETDNGKKKLLIKRVIGTPGDVIDIHDGKVYVNGDMIDDSYTRDQDTNGNLEEITVPENSVFVLGDNRRVSVDSRYEEVGFIPYKSIIGKVVLKVLPFSDFGTVKNPYK